MKAPVKLSLFGLGLLLIFAVSLGAGRLTGPFDGPAQGAEMNSNSHAGGDTAGHTTGTPAQAPEIPGGLQIAQDGYRLDILTRALSTTGAEPFQFRVIGPDGTPLSAYTAAHDKDLHLVVVRRDLTGFQHVHPVLGGGGVWSIPLSVGQPGAYRVFADFQPAALGRGLILGADVNASGDYQPQPLGGPSRTATVDDYTVTLDGDLVAGTASKLTLTVRKDGAPVTDLQPYLGAFGHLVALRDGDLAYLHVHPEESDAAGPQIVFYAQVPSVGSYGLFLDFQHQGVVRTAAFTATSGEVTAPAAPQPSPTETGHGH